MAEPDESARRIHARLARERAEEWAKQLREARDLVRARLKGHVDAHKWAWPSLTDHRGGPPPSPPDEGEP